MFKSSASQTVCGEGPVCLIILYAGYTMRINAKTALVDVYYAKETIQPKTLITEDMISKTSVPVVFTISLDLTCLAIEYII